MLYGASLFYEPVKHAVDQVINKNSLFYSLGEFWSPSRFKSLAHNATQYVSEKEKKMMKNPLEPHWLNLLV